MVNTPVPDRLAAEREAGRREGLSKRRKKWRRIRPTPTDNLIKNGGT